MAALLSSLSTSLPSSPASVPAFLHCARHAPSFRFWLLPFFCLVSSSPTYPHISFPSSATSILSCCPSYNSAPHSLPPPSVQPVSEPCFPQSSHHFPVHYITHSLLFVINLLSLNVCSKTFQLFYPLLYYSCLEKAPTVNEWVYWLFQRFLDPV